MKKYIAVLALTISTAAMADSWAIKNNDGGEIVITDRVCTYNNSKHAKKLFDAYTYTKSGQITKGCWALIDNMVHVVWPQDGAQYSYPISEFYAKSKSGKSL